VLDSEPAVDDRTRSTCEEDLSKEPPDAPLREKVLAGAEPLILFAIAGG
jgi:hypothetical protein